MKRLILSLFLIAPLMGLAQESQIDSLTNKITYTEVVKTPGTKVQLFDKAMEWLATSFKLVNDVVQIKDKEAGKIVASLLVYSCEEGRVYANIIILIKDDKFKYTITDLVFNGKGNFRSWQFEADPAKANITKRGVRNIKDNAFLRVQNLIQSLKSKMSSPNSVSEF
ncbi:DUF4468 domain-containing protein [Pedobacter cryoconitis]|uniref:DUF4468 domain-containing protein n=1 Tax=Pedobacter cryoconitis TaxID=188932 RepID=A0A7X0J3F5_9SPHI|nr:DUF4468 domain-containing protein [Pedobacter cryoconitis]MBB6500145.1 hypothetical protein [Pedobacter cryoconitis]